MYKQLVFRKPNDNDENILKYFNLKTMLKNDRTSISENDNMRMSIDKKVIRVMLFDETNEELLNNLRLFFYGGNYER